MILFTNKYDLLDFLSFFFTKVLRPGGKHRALFSLSFCLDTKERKNQGFEFLFCLNANNFNSFLKLKFFKNVLPEILKIKCFSSVAKTMKLKAEYFRRGEPYYSLNSSQFE